MNRKLERLAVLFTFVVLTTRCSGSVDSGSQTHWMAPCTADAACGEGLGCVCGVCTRTCSSSSDCSALQRSAVCAEATSAAHTSLCGGAENSSLCLPTCQGGCRTNEQCIDGACVPRSATLVDSGAGGSGGSGTEGGHEAGTGGPCGSTTCAADELCVHQATGTCSPASDGGQCPPGSQPFDCPATDSGSVGCVTVSVSSYPPPHCEPIPSACGSVIDCSCIECSGGADFCASVSGHDVTCMNVGP